MKRRSLFEEWAHDEKVFTWLLWVVIGWLGAHVVVFVGLLAYLMWRLA